MAGSAFGAMAAATVAASAAYACHPKASVVFSTYNPMPGEHVRVQGNGFDAGSTIRIWFGTETDSADSLRPLGSTVAGEVDPSGRPQVDLGVRIPPNASWGTYLLGATQEGGKNPGLFRAPVTVGPPSESGVYTRERRKPTGPPPPPAAPVVTGDVSLGGGRASEPSSVVVSTPAPAAASASIAPTAGATSSADRPVAVPAAQEQVVDPRSEAPASALVPFESTAAPVASLWSGLDPALVPARLDAPAPPPQKGAAALGMVLLGFGAAALAGAGLSIGRRRLPLATAASDLSRRR